MIRHQCMHKLVIGIKMYTKSRISNWIGYTWKTSCSQIEGTFPNIMPLLILNFPRASFQFKFQIFEIKIPPEPAATEVGGLTRALLLVNSSVAGVERFNNNNDNAVKYNDSLCEVGFSSALGRIKMLYRSIVILGLRGSTRAPTHLRRWWLLNAFLSFASKQYSCCL